MNIKLQLYSDKYRKEMVSCIADFFGFHIRLNTNSTIDKIEEETAEQNLKEWILADNELYMIFYDKKMAGFLRIGFRGENVAWIEDVFVKEEYRNKGIATESILQAEEIIKEKQQYTAICFDVVPRNLQALKLYHKLGYDRLSMITVRKELEHKDSVGTQNILGMDFKI